MIAGHALVAWGGGGMTTKVSEVFQVSVWDRDGVGTQHRNVTGVGIGHQRKDLVLVPDQGAPIEVGSNWKRIEIDREARE